MTSVAAIGEDHLRLLLETAFPDAPSTDVQSAVCALVGCTEAEALALLSLAPNPAEAKRWWADGTDPYFCLDCVDAHPLLSSQPH